MDINEKINVELTYKDVALLTVALSIYVNTSKNGEMSNHAKSLIRV